MSESFNLDAASQALDAMKAIADAIRAAETPNGTGSMTCPRCGGTLRFAWARRRRSSRPLSYVATCDTTEGCLKFMGH